MDDGFLDDILAVEAAAADLQEAQRSNSSVLAEAAAHKGRSCPQILIQAAELIALLGDSERARTIVEGGLGLGGPTAPLQHAYARHSRLCGDLVAARHWLRSAMLRARPNAAMALELAEIELLLGNDIAASQAVALAVRLRWIDRPGLLSVADRLEVAGRPDLATIALMMIHQRGEGDAALRLKLSALLKAHQPFADVPVAARERLMLAEPETVVHAAAESAHDRLAGGFGTALVESARGLEESSRWLTIDQLGAFLRARIEAGEPFSWVRGGDGEGRFVAAMNRASYPALTQDDADAMLQQIWTNWFGQDLAEIDAGRLAQLSAKVDDAFRTADLVGMTSVAVLEHDRRHFGYRAALHVWQQGLPSSPDQRYTDASNHCFLLDRDPCFAKLLAGVDFLAVISPHRGLARRLQAQTAIASVIEYIIPGESRLMRAEELANRGEHFPKIFDRLMNEIRVPFRGACFLVAGGLLGKIYCHRIRELGGIALDIGAVADIWAGIDTRRHGVTQLLKYQLPA